MGAAAVLVAAVFVGAYALLVTHNPVLLVTDETIDGEFEDLNVLFRGFVSFAFAKVFAPSMWPLALVQVAVGLDIVRLTEQPYAEQLVFAAAAAIYLAVHLYTRDDAVSLEDYNDELLERDTSPRKAKSESRAAGRRRRASSGSSLAASDSEDDAPRQSSPVPRPSTVPERKTSARRPPPAPSAVRGTFAPRPAAPDRFRQSAQSSPAPHPPARAEPATRLPSPAVERPSTGTEAPTAKKTLSVVERAREQARLDQQKRLQERVNALKSGKR